MQSLEHFYPQLDKPQKVVITTHQKPDPDAMGSSLGLYHFLIQFGHEVQVISPTNWAGFLDWMPGCENVLDYEKNRDKSEEAIASAQLIFCLDFNILSRTKRMAASLEKASAIRILIDHHQQPQTAAEWIC
jgi:bifunctional oligoribonuclease and PAP phosphatase NrnA